MCLSGISSMTGFTIRSLVTSAKKVFRQLLRLPSRITKSAYKFQEVDRVRWLPAITGRKVPQKCMAHPLRNLQALLRHDNRQLHSPGTRSVQAKGSSNRQDKHRRGGRRHRQRRIIDPVLFQELRPEILLKTLLHHCINLPGSLQAHHWKTFCWIPPPFLKQANKHHQRRYHQLQDTGIELRDVLWGSR